MYRQIGSNEIVIYTQSTSNCVASSQVQDVFDFSEIYRNSASKFQVPANELNDCKFDIYIY